MEGNTLLRRLPRLHKRGYNRRVNGLSKLITSNEELSIFARCLIFQGHCHVERKVLHLIGLRKPFRSVRHRSVSQAC